MFHISFETDGDEFDNELAAAQVAKHLRAVADEVEKQKASSTVHSSGRIRADNGERIGHWEITPD